MQRGRATERAHVVTRTCVSEVGGQLAHLGGDILERRSAFDLDAYNCSTTILR